jgi:hypothetical protein
VLTLLQALLKGDGIMAQFSHSELGGMGQWSRGGMTMIGDMFNSSLKAKVDGLCSELAELLSREPSQTFGAGHSSQAHNQPSVDAAREFSLFVPGTGSASADWWGDDLGALTALGSQNHISYAYFRTARRLAVKVGEQVVIYDTGEHEISGISQQQGSDTTLIFTSQRGPVRLDELDVVTQSSQPEPGPKLPADPIPAPAGSTQSDDVFLKLERLAELRAKGIISDEEFSIKKLELLGRI